MCSRWIKCDPAKAAQYDITKTVILCTKCQNTKYLYLVHVEDGDYTCYDCHTDVETCYLCINCRNNTKPKPIQICQKNINSKI